MLLDVEGTTVTIDAGGCHKEIAELIRAKKADYILGLKGNQGTLLAEAENFFNQVFALNEKEWMSALRRAVQNMIKLDHSKKLSTNKKCTLAAVSPEYWLRLLGLAEII